MVAPFARRLTGLFTRHPSPGKVKTRLCPPLLPEQAARLAEAMLCDTVARCAAGQFRTVLVFTPPEEAPWFRGRFPELSEQRPQLGADLGQRMAHFVTEVFARREAATLVLIGSDQPFVPLERLHEAHRRLEQGAGCVLGPDPGGGYYLVGLRRSVPELFTAVSMSSPDMCGATEALAHRLGLRVCRLAEHGDVDVAADLQRLVRELALPADEHAPDYPRHTRRLFSELWAGLP